MDTPTSVLLPAYPRQQYLAGIGVPTPPLYLIAPQSAEYFRNSILKIKSSAKGAAVDVYSVEDYAAMLTITTENGSAGFAVKEGELVSVFATDAAPRGIGRHLAAAAIALGAIRADCYDTVLPRIYAREGFTVVARTGFVDEYAPEDWDYEFFGPWKGGRPDVVFLSYSPAAVDGEYHGTEGRRVDTYEEGLAAAAAR